MMWAASMSVTSKKMLQGVPAAPAALWGGGFWARVSGLGLYGYRV